MTAASPSGRAVVVGGGLAGLAAAHHLLESGGHAEVVLLEAAERLGGAVSTCRRDGFLLEGGPDSFVTDRPWALDLCRRLGLGHELIPTSAAHRGVYVVSDGRLLPIPEGFALFAPARLRPFLASPLLSWRGKARALGEILVRSRSAPGESVGAFVRRRFGPELLDRLVEPLVSGIYSTEPDRLSLRATFPRFLELESRHGSLIRGLRAGRRTTAETEATGPRYGFFATLRSGMATLVAGLADRLGDRARTGAPVEAVEPEGSGWIVRTAGGEEIETGALVLALPGFAAAPLLRGHDAELAELLDAIPYGSSSLVHLGFRRNDVPHPLAGFGFVVPARERGAVSACTFSSVKFPDRAPAGSVLLRGFLRDGAGDDANLISRLREELHTLLGIEAEPLLATVHRHPRGLAQYPLGHRARLAAIERRVQLHRGLRLAGTALVGGGVPGAIRSGELAADGLLAREP